MRLREKKKYMPAVTMQYPHFSGNLYLLRDMSCLKELKSYSRGWESDKGAVDTTGIGFIGVNGLNEGMDLSQAIAGEGIEISGRTGTTFFEEGRVDKSRFGEWSADTGVVDEIGFNIVGIEIGESGGSGRG